MTDIRPAGPFSRWERMLALRYLRSKRRQGGVALISAISFVCIALAVATLVIVMAVFNGFRAELLEKMLGFNGHILVTGEVLREGQTNAAVARLRDAPGVIMVTPQTVAQSIVSANGVTNGVYVRGVSAPDLAATRIIVDNIRSGSLNGYGEGDYGGDLIILGDGLAASLGVRPGDGVTMTSPESSPTAFGALPARKTYTVAATFSVGMSQYDQAFIYMPLEQAQLFFGRGGDVDVIEVMVKEPDPETIDRYMSGIRTAAGLKAIVTDWRQTNASYWGALQVERTMMRTILMVLVVIAAVTIAAGLVMLVKNKERDIAILRTMGAGQGSIMRVFMMAGAAIGLLATPAGVLIGVVFCHYIEPIQNFVEWVTGAQVFNADVYFLAHLPAKIDWREVLTVTGWTLVVSIIVTLYPSWQASRIDPVEALRYE